MLLLVNVVKVRVALAIANISALKGIFELYKCVYLGFIEDKIMITIMAKTIIRVEYLSQVIFIVMVIILFNFKPVTVISLLIVFCLH